MNIFPSGAPFIIIRNKKISLSYRGKPVFCNICMSDTHRTSDCPSRHVSHCYLSGSTEHRKKDCEQFVPFRRARGRRYSREIEEHSENGGTNKPRITVTLQSQKPFPILSRIKRTTLQLRLQQQM